MIYFITDGEFVKIGFTDSDDVDIRLRALQTGNARKLEVLGKMIGGRDEEALLHRVFSGLCVRGEWYICSIENDTLDEIGGSPSGRYLCECGRGFAKPQSYSAHTRHCDIYQRVAANGHAKQPGG